MSLPSSIIQPQQRLYYIDWLRVLAMFCVFLFHNARFFDTFSDWHVKNAATALGPTILVAFLDIWMMPLFFLVAGAGTYFASKTRNAGQYAGERSLRLLIPLMFGMFVILVPQAYYEAVFHGQDFSGNNFFQLYWIYLQTLPELKLYHLWFLRDLFIFSLITIPVFFLRFGSGKSMAFKVAEWLSRPWALVLSLILSLALVDAFLYPGGFWGNRDSGGWNIVSYFLFFVFGYLIFANPRIMETIKKYTWPALGVGVIASVSLLAFFLSPLTDLQAYYGTLSYTAGQAIQALNTWCWLLAILGLGARFLTPTNRFLQYSNEAVLPFYILHQTVIIVIGFYVVQWNTGVGLKYLVISTTSFAGIMLIYELLVRRINILRFVFGMRQRRRPREALPAVQPGA
jgi:glucan biosynthesis protein C